jgi:thiamine-monophosphate kinase
VPVAEKALIAQIRRIAAGASQNLTSRACLELVEASARATRPNKSISAGIGDDCAALRLPQGEEALVTTDFSLEGVHFRRNWHPPESVGHRCLTRGLSDIAAMGGKPIAAFLSLALPRDLPQAWVGRFLRGLISLAEKFGVTLAGGDTAESPKGILADIIVVGTVPQGKAVLRSGARPGDRIYVSGELGGSAAALLQMRKRPKHKVNPAAYPQHFFPEPRIKVGHRLLQRRLASALIDTSDGLSTDLAHICQESGVGAVVDAELIPRARVGKPVQEVGLELALHGGEDYELLFTVSPKWRVPSRIAGVAITEIGYITRNRKVLLKNRGVDSEFEPRGWEHFRR